LYKIITGNKKNRFFVRILKENYDSDQSLTSTTKPNIYAIYLFVFILVVLVIKLFIS